jgi:2'-5' RNA ligase
VRWVSLANLHLTLRFLGDTRPEQVGEVAAGLRRVAGEQARFEVALGPAGCFPNVRRPSVVWVGLEDPSGALSQLQHRVEEMARRLGWGAERRPFQPHLTLGRVGDGALPPTGEWLPPAPTPPVAVPVAEVCLVESRLRPRGAEYYLLEATPLRADGPDPGPVNLPA